MCPHAALDGGRDITDPAPDGGCGDAVPHRTASRLTQRCRLRAQLTNSEGDGRITVPTPQGHPEVDTDQVAVSQHLGPRDPVHHRIIHRDAGHRRKRRHPEASPVAEEGRLRASGGAAVPRELVQVTGRDPWTSCGPDSGQHLSHHQARGPHQHDLLRRLRLNSRTTGHRQLTRASSAAVTR